jgi:bifunctional non-homologous end joining protein LigD
MTGERREFRCGEAYVAFQRKKRSIRGTKAAYPGFIEPILAEQVDRPPRGERWLHEIKFDGYRAQLHLISEDRKVFTRRGVDWTRRFKKIADDAYLINASSAIIDGEIVVPGEGGKKDFAVLQKSLRGNARNLVMIAFDLLYLDNVDLRNRPLTERKALLKKLIAGTRIEFSESFDMNGAELYRRSCEGGLEGVVSKIADSPYQSGRHDIWSNHLRPARDFGDRRFQDQGRTLRWNFCGPTTR